MFRRLTPPAAQPTAPVRARLDKVLPVIPFSPDWAERPVKPEPNESRPVDGGHKLQVAGRDLPLLIFAEADASSREVIRGLASKWGYEVIATIDGRGALEAVGRVNRAAIVLVNQDMGGMSSVEFGEAARATKQLVYTILVAERSATSEVSEVLTAGADDYLITPFHADELQARLRVAERIIGLQAELAASLADLERLSTPQRCT